jgi:hypothetical protein
MDSSSPAPLPVNATNSEIGAAYKKLRNLIHCIAISVIILTGTVFVFIMREVVMVRGQIRRSIAYIHEFHDSNLPNAMQQLQKELIDFAQKNPDFRQVLARYAQPRPSGVQIGTATNSPAPIVTTPKTNR